MNFTIPNLLSLLRMGLIPLFIIAVLNGRPKEAVLIFLVAGLTDALDGLIARFWSQQTVLGAYLDPMADKLLLVSAYATLAVPGVYPGVPIPVWVSVLVITRDVLIVVVSLILYLAVGVSKFPPAKISKWTTAVQVGAVVLVLLTGLFEQLAQVTRVAVILVAIFTVLSGLNYMYLANRLAAAANTEERDPR